jgi:hypothetical protein
MASLPSELWTTIIEDLPRSDLKSCRLLNRQVCALASIPLFSILYITANDNDSLGKAVKISKCPKLNECVKTLVHRVDAWKDQLISSGRSDRKTSVNGFDLTKWAV